MTKVFFIFLFCLHSAFAALESEISAVHSRTAYFTNEISEWASVLNYAFADRLTVDPLSAPPRDFLFKLFDGVTAEFKNFPGQFVVFDGPQAILKVRIPQWHRPNKISFRAIERSDQKNGEVLLRLDFKDKHNVLLKVERSVQETKGKVQIVKYEGKFGNYENQDADLFIQYKNEAQHNVSMDELTFDDLSIPTKKLNFQYLDLQQWLSKYGKNESQRIDKLDSKRNLKNSELFKVILGQPSHPLQTKTISVKRYETNKYDLYSFLFQVDHTGKLLFDLVSAQLLIPHTKNQEGYPLMLLNHQGIAFGFHEPLGVMGFKELGLADELVENGIAVLVTDSFYRNGFTQPYNGSAMYRYHSNWSVTGKEIDSHKRVLDFVVGSDFVKLTNIKFNPKKIGVFGFSYGAYNSLFDATFDSRYSYLGMAHLENYSQDWKSFADALYVPQLSFYKNSNPYPIHICNWIKSLNVTTVLASTGDEGLKNHYGECLNSEDQDKKVLVNALGKIFTESERKEFMSSIFKFAGVNGKPKASGPQYNLWKVDPSTQQRESDWRSSLLEGMNTAK